MDSRRQHRRLPSSLLALLFLVLLQPRAVLAAFKNDFSAYPSGARDCLSVAATNSACDGDDVSAMNNCLCSNGGHFVTLAAMCIGLADLADLETVYTTMAAACAYSNTPLSVSQKDFLEAGNNPQPLSLTIATSTSPTSSTSSTSPTSSTSSATSTSSTSSAPSASSSLTTSTKTSTTTTSTHYPYKTTVTTQTDGHVTVYTTTVAGPQSTDGGGSSSDGGHSTGISATARIGIIAGASVAGVAILAALAFFIVRMRRQRQVNEESRPMLGVAISGVDSGGGGGFAYASGTELARLSGSNISGYSHDWKAGAVAGDETKYPLRPDDPFLGPPQPAGGVFELPVQQTPVAPAEMPATPMVSPGTVYGPAGQQQQQPQQQQWGQTAYR